ncbi:MAG: tetratricopeptide repeat protein [Firmicutes bacterium]|nr:tetratricopeptide repeat protein [Bacillota bacterium]
MSNPRNPYIRVPLAIALFVMLFFMPTREFLKTTFIIGIPFIFLMGFMFRQPRNSWSWRLSALGLILIIGVYGYQLVYLPERIQVRGIITQGAGLVAEGKYDEAIAGYQKLGDLGKPVEMEKKIAAAESEKAAHLQLEYARQLIASGYTEEARMIMAALPAETRAAQEAKELLKNLP